MRVAVTGGRSVDNKSANEIGVFACLERVHAKAPFSILIEGGQRTFEKNTKKIIGGVDFWCSKWAISKGIIIITEPAQWEDMSPPCIAVLENGRRYNKLAGPNRNRKIMVMHQPELLIAFPGGRGTQNAIDLARKYEIKVLQFSLADCRH